MDEKQKVSNVAAETRAIIYGGVAAVLAAALMYGATRIESQALSSLSAYGFATAIGVALFAFVVFIIGYDYSKSGRIPTNTLFLKLKRILTVFALAFAHAAITFLLVVVMTTIATQSISNIELTPVLMISVTATLAAVVTYVVYIQAASMEVDDLAGLMTVFIISGSLASMVTAGDTHWWQHHLSALGTGNTISSYAFNLTMVISGVIVATLADMIVDVFASIKEVSQKESHIRANIIRIAFVVAGVAMIGVGLIPVSENRLIHDICANTVTLSLGTMVILLPWLAPIMSRTFIAFSYLMLAIVVGAYVMRATYGISILTLELIGATALFIWMILFVRYILAIYHDTAQTK
jgi:MFS family permease